MQDDPRARVRGEEVMHDKGNSTQILYLIRQSTHFPCGPSIQSPLRLLPHRSSSDVTNPPRHWCHYELAST